MKRLLIALVLFSVVNNATAQDEGYQPGFKKQNLYLGAGLNAGFFQGWILGINPEAGYSVTRFLDLGLATNFNYITQNSGPELTFRFRTLGAGPYVRVWIANQFFVTAQYEYNFTRATSISSGVKTISNFEAPSLLVGGGYGNRFIGSSQFFTTIMIDVTRNINSPYYDAVNNVSLPVFRTGFLFYLPSKEQRIERQKQRLERRGR